MGIPGMVLGILAIGLAWAASISLFAISGNAAASLGLDLGLYLCGAPMAAVGLYLSISSYRTARRNAAGTWPPIAGMVTNTVAAVMIYAELLSWGIVLARLL